MRRAIWASSADVRESMSAFSLRSVATALLFCASADATEGDMAGAEEEVEEVGAAEEERAEEVMAEVEAAGGLGAKRAKGFSRGLDVVVGT